MVNKKTLISLFIAFIMVFSIFGFIADFAITRTPKIKYNKYTFKQSGDKWETKYHSKNIQFYSTPKELENIELSEDIKNTLKNGKLIYITYDVNDTKADVIGAIVYHMQEVITQATNNVVQRGLVNPQNYALPKIDCTNSTFYTPVILIKNLNNTKITSINNCIIFGSSYEFDYLRIGERLIYTILGIMN